MSKEQPKYVYPQGQSGYPGQSQMQYPPPAAPPPGGAQGQYYAPPVFLIL